MVFTAIAGLTYTLEARTPLTSTADMMLELYGNCGSVTAPGQDPTFGTDVAFQFIAPASGQYRARLLNHAPTVFGPAVSYALTVRAPATASPGALIIVAGRLRSNDAWDSQANIRNVARQVYRLFRGRGYPQERIYLLATDMNLDADGDNASEVNALANLTNLQFALTEWTQDKQLGPDRALTIYLVDHGDRDTFYLDEPRAQRLVPGQLDGWLDTVEVAAPGVKVNVFLEACYSGSFIELAQSVSQAGRLVVSSAGAYGLAYTSRDSALFSDVFLSGLGQGMSVLNAYTEGRDAAHLMHPDQTAWLDGDGDGVPNEPADEAEAARRGFSVAGSLADDLRWMPYIQQADIRNRQGAVAEIWAEVLDDKNAISAVWAVVYPPSYQPPTSSETLVSGPPPMPLAQRSAGQYAVTYPNFTERGLYRIVIYAVDGDNLQSRLKEITLLTGMRVFLPLVIKQ